MKFNLPFYLRKSYVKNGIWLYFLQAFNTIIPLITLPYITRILGTAGWGTFSVSFNIISYLQVVVEYGFGMSATREVTLSSQKPEAINRIYTGVFFARLILLFACFVPGAVYLLLNAQDTELCRCFCVLFASLIGYIIQLNWLYQGKQEMKFISITNISARLISVILIFTMVKSPDDLILYALLYASVPILSGIIGQIIARIRYRVKMIRFSFRDIRQELYNGWFVFTTQLSSKVFGAIGITFLGIVASKQEVGIYSAIQKIATVFILAWSPISQVLYPMVSKRITADFAEGLHFVKRIRKYALILFGVLCILCSVFSRQIVSIAFGAEYSVKSYWVVPLLGWVLISIVNNFHGIQILLGSGHDKEYSKCFQIGVLITILLNGVLIFLFHGDGACVAPAISEAILGIMLYRKVNQILNSECRPL